MKNTIRHHPLPMLVCAAVFASTQPLVACDALVSEIKKVYFGVEVPLPNPEHPITVSIGHTDLDMPYLNCAWVVDISPDGGNIPSEDALVFAGPQARFNLPSIPPGFEFIGAQPNQTFWVLPQNQTSGVVFLGFSTELMTANDRARICTWNPNDPRGGANVAAKWFRVELVGVNGPDGGHFAGWQTSGTGSVTKFFSTFEGGIAEDDAIHLLAGSHAHMNWAFTQSGLYELSFRLSTYVTPMRGDLECDCTVDLLDVPAFVEALLTPDDYPEHFPDCNIMNADINNDGLRDGSDIVGFVDLLVMS